MKKKKWIWLAPLAILALFAFIALGAEIVRLLWNWVFPPLFGWREIDFRQGLAILVLSRILFGTWGGRGSERSGIRRRMKDRMAGRMAEHWEQMTPEERERFREAIGRCGTGPAPGESQGA